MLKRELPAHDAQVHTVLAKNGLGLQAPCEETTLLTWDPILRALRFIFPLILTALNHG